MVLGHSMQTNERHYSFGDKRRVEEIRAKLNRLDSNEFGHSQPFSGKNKGARKSLEPLDFIGDRERIRTAGLPLRRRSLYPAELHNQIF